MGPNLGTGGSERQMLHLAGGLPRDEFEVRFILFERGSLASEAEGIGLRVDVLGLTRQACQRFGISCVSQSGRALRSYLKLARDLDIVDAWLVPAYTFAGLVQPLARVPVLLAGRRSMLDVARTRRWYRELSGSLAMRQVDAVVANSQAAAEQAVLHEGLDPSRVHVVHNAVVPIVVDDGVRDTLRHEWGYSEAEIVVGCVGRLMAGKGHRLLLDVAEQLRDEWPSVRYVFIGDGPLRDDLDRELDERRLRGVVAIHPSERDARHCYVALDIVAQASDSEGMPNAVLEAATAARAIVATDVGGTREIIDSEEAGILVPKGDASRMSAAIARLAASEGLRQAMGDAARELSRGFTVERLARETGLLYQRLLDGARS